MRRRGLILTIVALAGSLAMAVGSAQPAVAAAAWSPQTSGTTNQLFGVSFVDATHGWTVGNNGTILVTGNGGATWTGQTSGTTNSLLDVSFVDVSRGWAVGFSGTIRVTTNGGATWTGQTPGVPN